MTPMISWPSSPHAKSADGSAMIKIIAIAIIGECPKTRRVPTHGIAIPMTLSVLMAFLFFGGFRATLGLLHLLGHFFFHLFHLFHFRLHLGVHGFFIFRLGLFFHLFATLFAIGFRRIGTFLHRRFAFFLVFFVFMLLGDRASSRQCS